MSETSPIRIEIFLDDQEAAVEEQQEVVILFELAGNVTLQQLREAAESIGVTLAKYSSAIINILMRFVDLEEMEAIGHNVAHAEDVMILRRLTQTALAGGQLRTVVFQGTNRHFQGLSRGTFRSPNTFPVKVIQTEEEDRAQVLDSLGAKSEKGIVVFPEVPEPSLKN